MAPGCEPPSSPAPTLCMDILFPRVFLLVFAQLAVGGLFCLSIPPFHEMERGYYKSSAFVFWAIGSLAALGHVLLLRRPGADASLTTLEVSLWCAFSLAAGAYLISLWYEHVALRARLFAAAWMIGIVALVAGGLSFASASAIPLAKVVFPAGFLVAALTLGTAASGMLLGHWYLIDRDLPLAPLWRVLRAYVGCLGAQGAFLIATAGALTFAPGNYAESWLDYRWVLLARMAISPLGTGVLAAMIWRTLLIPQTMAATGLFYIAILGVTVGEIIGRYLLFRTGLPL